MYLTKILEKLKGRLFQNPELRARQIYEFLNVQSDEVKDFLQGYLNDKPLKQKPRGRYLSDEDSD